MRHVSVWGARLGALREAALDARRLRTLVLVAARLHHLEPNALSSVSRFRNSHTLSLLTLVTFVSFSRMGVHGAFLFQFDDVNFGVVRFRAQRIYRNTDRSSARIKSIKLAQFAKVSTIP